jgi:acyl carrier protein
LYKTGDRARFDHKGNLHFLGRSDAQIKLRGYRIELQEIVAALRNLPTVRDAAVVARREADRIHSLSAYLIATDDTHQVDIAEVRGALAAVLPNWMIPSEFSWLDEFPLNTSGKVDRNALLERGTLPQVAKPVAPRNPLEELICGLWEEVLGHGGFGIDDNFFELGGHSLLVMRLTFRLEEETGLSPRETDLFTSPTIRSLAKVISSGLTDPAPSREMAP